MPMKAPAPAAYDWGGFYVGAHVGWADANTTSQVTGIYSGIPEGTSTHSENGVAGGVNGGYNWVVTPNWLLGLEADGTASAINGKSSGCGTFECDTASFSDNGFISFRGRIGFIWDNLLLYGTGGYAAVNHRLAETVTCFTTSAANPCPGAAPTNANSPGHPATAAAYGIGGASAAWSNGWVYGGGLEWGFANRWTARIEYTRYDFSYNGGINFGPCGQSCPPGQFFIGEILAKAFHNTLDDNVVMVGINYLFWPGL